MDGVTTGGTQGTRDSWTENKSSYPKSRSLKNTPQQNKTNECMENLSPEALTDVSTLSSWYMWIGSCSHLSWPVEITSLWAHLMNLQSRMQESIGSLGGGTQGGKNREEKRRHTGVCLRLPWSGPLAMCENLMAKKTTGITWGYRFHGGFGKTRAQINCFSANTILPTVPWGLPKASECARVSVGIKFYTIRWSKNQGIMGYYQ